MKLSRATAILQSGIFSGAARGSSISDFAVLRR